MNNKEIDELSKYSLVIYKLHRTSLPSFLLHRQRKINIRSQKSAAKAPVPTTDPEVPLEP